MDFYFPANFGTSAKPPCAASPVRSAARAARGVGAGRPAGRRVRPASPSDGGQAALAASPATAFFVAPSPKPVFRSGGARETTC